MNEAAYDAFYGVLTRIAEGIERQNELIEQSAKAEAIAMEAAIAAQSRMADASDAAKDAILFAHDDPRG